MNLYDYITISAHYNYFTEDKFNCQEKIRQFAPRAGYERAKKMVEDANGCNEISKNIKYTIDNIGYKSCLCNFKNPNMEYYFTLYNMYDKGILPFPGSVIEQPNKIIEILNFIKVLQSKREEEAIKKMKSKNNG